MDDDDEDNPKECQKYWIPGLKTIAFTVNSRAFLSLSFSEKRVLPSLVLTSYIVYSAIAVTFYFDVYCYSDAV